MLVGYYWKEDVMIKAEGGERGLKKVAVCISGQTARWQPQHLFEGLIFPNLQENYHFYLFFNMQMQDSSSETVFNTDISNTFTASIMSTLNYDEAIKYLQDITFHSSSITIASLKYRPFIRKEALLRYFNTTALDRITQYTDVQATILNMYEHQVRCIKQLLRYELEQNVKFDYVISTREDVFFFRPLNLSTITNRLRKDTSPEAILSLNPKTSNDVCDIFYKKCLNFWGFNMRLFILTREVAIPFLGNRLSFYKYLYKINRTIENPERFELNEANALRFFGCPLSVEDYPVTAVRHYYDGQICFVFFEIDRCVPVAFQQFAKNQMCLEKRRNFFLEKIYTELPELLKADFVTGIGNLSLTEVDKTIRKNIDLGSLQRYYRKIIREVPDYQNRSAVVRYLEKNHPISARRMLPKTLLRFTADHILVEQTWTEREY
eukprot:gene14076-15555_t